MHDDRLPAFEPIEFTHDGHAFRVEPKVPRAISPEPIDLSPIDEITVSIDGESPIPTGLVVAKGLKREAVVALVLMWFVEGRRADPAFGQRVSSPR